MRNQVTFKVSGEYALFTDPMTKIGGEKSTLMIPTYQAMKAICESVYWKPSIQWIVDEATVLNPIRTECKGIRPIKYNGGNELAYYTYLSNVSYIVKTHFEFNQNRKDLQDDFNENKHYSIMKRCIARGGRRDVYLGTRECQAYVETISGDEKSHYEKQGQLDFGLMYHSLSYPDQNGEGKLKALFWHPKMLDGVIKYCRPEECDREIFVKDMQMKPFTMDSIVGVTDEYAELFKGSIERSGG